MSAMFLRVLVEASLRASILAALVAGILAVLRVRAGEMRHAAWTMVVCAMLALPLSAWLPLPSALTIPAPSALAVFDGVGTAAPSLARFRQRWSAKASAERRRSPKGSRSTVVETALGLETIPRLLSVQPFPPSQPLPSVQPLQPFQPFQPLPPIPPFVLAVYLFGLFCSAVWCGLGWRAAARLARLGPIVPDDELPADRAGARRGMVIRESLAIVTPVTVGIVAPTILLPVGWREYSDDTRRAVLAHETAHVARRDPLVLFLARVNRCVFWFHPLAWWLPRALAIHAEHASDAVAVRAIGEPRRYAAILLEMARAVHDGGGRVTRQAIGIGGHGLLGRRVERLLRNDASATASRTRRRIVAASCVVAIAVTAACRPERREPRFEASAAIEQRDRALRTTLRAIQSQDSRDFQRANWDQYGAARIESLEAAVARAPDDLSALKDLLIGYWVEPSADRRRAHILGLIERHPDAELAGSVEARLFPSDVDTALPADPAGYEQAKTLWLAHANRADVSAVVLGNAASFFETADKPLAERLLLRARALDPHGPWSARLGYFYARVLAGIRAPASTSRLRVLNAAASRSPYGVIVRQKLGESTDEELLTAAGWSLARAGREPWVDFDPDLWAEACLKRALQLNPEGVLAHTELLHVRRQREAGRGEPLWAAPPARQYQVVSAVPEAERFERLPRLARQSLIALGDIARWDDPNLRGRLDLARQQARQYAEDALALAPKFRDHPDYGAAIYTANMTLGALALRDGDTAAAVRFLLRASDAPASEALAYSDDVVSGMRWRLAADLLERGERDAVVRFLTRMAETNLAHRGELREAAAAIRRGETPRI